MSFPIEHDSTKQKVERRRTTYKLAKRRKALSILATNFPGPHGREFAKTWLSGKLKADITLVDRESFSKISRKTFGENVKLIPRTDIFFQMLSNEYDFLDIDLCGGLSIDAVKSIETCTSWKTIVLSCTDKFRSRWGDKVSGQKSAKPEGVHLQNFITSWCEKNKWGCQLSFSPGPYRRSNKNERAGLVDGRGPWYYTFIITR